MKRINQVFIALFIITNFFLAFEIALRVYLPPIPEADLIRDQALFSSHPKFIFRHVKNKTVTETKKVGDQTIFKNVQYSFDSFHRRKTWQNAQIPKISSALFFGSSVVFGKGLNDQETLPSFFAKRHPDWEVHNYAVRGWGTQQYLEALRSIDFSKEVAQPVKLLIFVISVNHETGHVQRLQGTMDLCTPCWWMANLPAYRQTQKTGKFEFKGTFDKFMPIRYYLYKFLQNLRMVRYFRFNVSEMEQDDYDTYTKLLLEILNTAKEKFPSAQVYFINHPFSDTESTKKLIKSSGYEDLPVLDYAHLIAKEDLPAYYFGIQWPYPKPELNQRLAKEISADTLSSEAN